MKKFTPFFVLISLVQYTAAQVNQAGFTMQDSACGSNTILVNDQSNYGTKYYWWSCNGPQNFNLQQSGTNLTNIALDGPVRMSLAHDASGYYGFVTDHFGVSLTKLSFGNSFENTPTAVNLGNFGGVINDRPEGINVRYDTITKTWFGYMVAALDNASRLIQLYFGSSLANTPTATNLGNFGGIINFGHGVDIFNYGGNWIGFIINAFGDNLAVLNFGASLANTPTVTDLGNLANFNYPTTIKLLENNGTWYGFVTSMANSSFIILNFGNSPLNTPTATNLGNLGVLEAPFDFKIFSYCDTIVGFISDHSLNSLYEVKFNPVDMSIEGTPTVALNGPFSTCEGMSETFRSNDSLFWYVVNVGTNSLTQVFFDNCNSLVGPYLSYNLPPIDVTAGMTTLSLSVDEGESTQQTICEAIIPGEGSISAGIISALSDSICAGQSCQLSLSGNSAATIQWQSSYDDSTYTNINDTSGSYSDATTQSAYFRVYVTNGTCSDTSAPFKLNVYSLPTPTLTVDDSIICPGDSAHLCTGNGYSSFNWNNGDTTSCIYIKTAGDYSVNVTGPGGCTGTSQLQGVGIIPVATPRLYAADSIICSTDSAQICASGSYVSLIWNTGDTASCIYAKNAGGYWVNVTDSLGCPALSGHQNIIVLPVPSVAIVVQGDTLSSYDASAYQWYLNGEPIQDATSPVYIAPEPGNYSVQITDTSGCTAISNTFYIVTTAIKDLPGNSNFEIYPVPASGSFNIRYEGMGPATYQMIMFNMLGEEVMQDNLNFTNGKITTVNASGLPKGTYLLQLQSAGEIYTRRVVIM